MEKGESSDSSGSDDIWGKLVPLNSSYSDIELRLNAETICSNTKIPPSEKQEWCEITREKDQNSALMKNKCSSSILVDGTVLREDDTITVTCGSEIILGPEADGFVRYMFKMMPAVEPCKKPLKVTIDPEHAKCPICLNIWHDVVTAAPCLHNFCNGCFSEWLKRCQDKHSSVLCPQCRAVVQFVGRNHFLHGIEEDILQSDSSLRRSDEELALLDSCSSIKSPLVVTRGRKASHKRARAPPDEEIERDSSCPQCGSEYAGFRCNERTVHLQCQSCGGMMPSRSNAPVPQHCLGCDRAFCGAYWHAMGVARSDVYPLCSHETLKPEYKFVIICWRDGGFAPPKCPKRNIYFSENIRSNARNEHVQLEFDSFEQIAVHCLTRLPLSAHEKNRHEQDITDKCIRQMERPLHDVISEWIRKMGNREVDRTRLPLKNSEMITPETYVCRDCYDKLVSFLLYWFRVTLPKHLLPPEAQQRDDCWYGYACRTQHHNEEHARKRNHVCRPTRGTRTP